MSLFEPWHSKFLVWVLLFRKPKTAIVSRRHYTNEVPIADLSCPPKFVKVHFNDLERWAAPHNPQVAGMASVRSRSWRRTTLTKWCRRTFCGTARRSSTSACSSDCRTPRCTRWTRSSWMTTSERRSALNDLSSTTGWCRGCARPSTSAPSSTASGRHRTGARTRSATASRRAWPASRRRSTGTPPRRSRPSSGYSTR